MKQNLFFILFSRLGTEVGFLKFLPKPNSLIKALLSKAEYAYKSKFVICKLLLMFKQRNFCFYS